jgi:hypothetical protein
MTAISLKIMAAVRCFFVATRRLNMTRIVATLPLAVVLLTVCNARADHHHKEWMKFLKGDWKYDWRAEDGSFQEKGEVSYTLAANGNVVVGRITTENGDKELETWGWEPDTSTMVLKGYSSNGSNWHYEYTKVDSDEMKGEGHGILPDGSSWEGEATIKKEDGGFVVRIEGTTDGKETVSIGKLTRKAFGDGEAEVPKKVLDGIGLLVGRWETTTYVNGEKVGIAKSERNWVPGEYCLQIDFSAEEDGSKRSGTGLFGWNAKTQQVVDHWFFAEGAYFTARYPLEKMGEKSWAGTFSFVEASGREVSGRCRLNRSTNGFEWTAWGDRNGEATVRKAVSHKIE